MVADSLISVTIPPLPFWSRLLLWVVSSDTIALPVQHFKSGRYSVVIVKHAVLLNPQQEFSR